MRKKKQVLVLYGGRSAEHEISCRSAAFVLRNLDPEKYSAHAIAIDKEGRWLPQNVSRLLEHLQNGAKSIPILPSSDQYAPLPANRNQSFTEFFLSENGALGQRFDREDLVIFPVLHGTFGEDGTLQGLFEFAELAYVGPDHLGSSVGMDKAVAKRLVQSAGVPVVPWLETRTQYWAENKAAICAEVAEKLGFPVFVKPAKLGSSVGISKVESKEALVAACDKALQFDDKLLIEKGLSVREIECAVLGDYAPRVSVPGEVIPHAEFYTYEAKYIDAEGASMAIPAKLEAAQAEEARRLSLAIFKVLDLYGMARVDLFLEKKTGAFYFNEVNTIPGFTELSQYPLLWKESGVEARELLDTLIDLAAKRQEAKSRLKRSR